MISHNKCYITSHYDEVKSIRFAKDREAEIDKTIQEFILHLCDGSETVRTLMTMVFHF